MLLWKTSFCVRLCLLIIIILLFRLINELNGTWLRLNLFSVNNTGFLLAHMTSLLLPSLMHIYLVYIVMIVFIPLMDRFDRRRVIPDLYIGALAAAGFVLPFSFQVCYTFLMQPSSALAVAWRDTQVYRILVLLLSSVPIQRLCSTLRSSTSVCYFY